LDAGEDVDLTGITLAVVDAIIEAGEREEAAACSSVQVVGSERFV
jgi:hypothetical protein